MPEATGLGADAARARETALTESARIHGEADRVVVPTLQVAYESALRGRRQLDVIGADVESAVANQQALALDTPAGAATFSTAGDSVLYCGNDKYGLLHIQEKHGPDWQLIADERWPSAGNWRYLADYAIGATLAYPSGWSTTKTTTRSPCTAESPYQTAGTFSRLASLFRQATGRSSRPSRKQEDEPV